MRNATPPDKWEQAAADAKALIKQYQSKISRLQRAAKFFDKCHVDGQPWPGTVNDSEHSGEDARVCALKSEAQP